jgi:hypothetical protein
MVVFINAEGQQRLPPGKRNKLFYYKILFILVKEKPTVETAGANDCLLYE